MRVWSVLLVIVIVYPASLSILIRVHSALHAFCIFGLTRMVYRFWLESESRESRSQSPAVHHVQTFHSTLNTHICRICSGVSLSTCLTACLSLILSIHLYTRLSTCLSLQMLRLPGRATDYLSLILSDSPPVCLRPGTTSLWWSCWRRVQRGRTFTRRSSAPLCCP